MSELSADWWPFLEGRSKRIESILLACPLVLTETMERPNEMGAGGGDQLQLADQQRIPTVIASESVLLCIPREHGSLGKVREELPERLLDGRMDFSFFRIV